jgi:hypothetical protein
MGDTSHERRIAKVCAGSWSGPSGWSNTAARGTSMAETKAISLLTDGRIWPRSIWETALAEMPSSRATARRDLPDRRRSSRSRLPRNSLLTASRSVMCSAPVVTRV